MRKWSFDVRKDDTLTVKGIAIILMLVHHLFAFPNRLVGGTSFVSMFSFADNTTFEWHFSAFSKICVAMFTLLAGYGIFKSYFPKYCAAEDRCESYIFFFKYRLKKLYFKVWPVFLVFVPLGFFLKKPNVTPYVAQWIKNALLIDTNFNFEWWFLTEYVILILLTPIVMWFFSRKRSNLYNDMVWIILFNVFMSKFVLSFILKFPYTLEFQLSYFWTKLSIALSLMPIYMTGAWLAKYDVFERVINSLRASAVKRVIVAVALIGVAYFLRDGWKQPDKWGIDFFDFAYASMITLGVILLTYRLGIVKKVFEVLGVQSTGIWLTHSFFCYYYFQKFIYYPKYSVLVFLLALAVSFTSAWIIDFGFNGILKLVSRNGGAERPEGDDRMDRMPRKKFKRRGYLRRPPRGSR